MMNIKQLERSQKILLEIKQLDSEIIELNKVAELIASGNADIDLTLKVKDNTAQEVENQPDTNTDELTNSSPLSFHIDYSRSIMKRFSDMQSSLFNNVHGSVSDNNKTTTEIKSSLSENLGFNVLAILLSEKQNRRNKLINSLKNMGVLLS